MVPGPKPKPAAKPGPKQSNPKPSAIKPTSSQNTAHPTTKRKRTSKASQGSPAPTGTRPTLSDGKVEREIWQPSDGNGDPTPETVEKNRNKKTGHPHWKLYTGRNVPKQPTITTPPRFVYLDDKAAWDILHSKNWTANEKHRFWSFDFTPQGRISFQRTNRGRPAYEKDGKTFTSIRRTKDKRYWFHGCHPPPPDDGSSVSAAEPAKDTVASGEATVAVPASQPTVLPQPTRQTQLTEHFQVNPTLKPPTPAPERKVTPEKPSQQSESILTESSPSGSNATSSPDLKRSHSSDSLTTDPAPKRQRKAITPYTAPAEPRSGDTELIEELRKELRACTEREARKGAELKGLQGQVDMLHEATLEVNKKLETAKAKFEASERKGEAFRALAHEFYARAVDQKGMLADRHAAVARLVEGASDLIAATEAIANGAKKELSPAAKMHGEVDSMLDKAEASMADMGLLDEFNAFVKEAMDMEE